MSDKDSDRRATKRQPVYLGVELVTSDGSVQSALTKNASDGGLLLLSRAKIAPDDRVELRVLEAGTGKVLVPVSGRVVRREELSEEESCIWTAKVAVALDEPFGDVYQKLEELGQTQAKIFTME
jgi:hypothetical protein